MFGVKVHEEYQKEANASEYESEGKLLTRKISFF